jgi:hypothetical protein
MYCRWLSLLLVLSLFAQVAEAQLAADVPQNAARDEVIKRFGWPVSVSKTEEREILNYPNYTVLLENGRVVRVAPKTAAPVRKSGPAVSVPPSSQGWQPASTRAPAAAPVTPVPTSKIVIPPALPAPVAPPSPVRSATSSAQPRPDPLAPLKRMAWILGGLLVLITAAGIVIAQRKRRGESDWAMGKKAAPALTTSPEPPLVARARPDPLKDGWTLGLLKEIEWHRYEQVVAEYYRLTGHQTA